MSYESDLIRNYSEGRARMNEAGYRFQQRQSQPPPPPPKPVPLSVPELDEAARAIADAIEAQHRQLTIQLARPRGARPSRETILCTVAEYYGVSRIDMKSARRTACVVRPRQVAMYLCATLTTCSLPKIGLAFGGRDHTTVHYARNKIAALRQEDPELDAELCKLEALFESLREGEGPPGKYPQHQPGRVGSPGGPTNPNSPGVCSFPPGDGAARSILPSLAHDDRAAPPVSQVRHG